MRAGSGTATVAVGAAGLGCQLRVQERPRNLGNGLVPGGMARAVRSRREVCGAITGWETAVDAALALLREVVTAGAKDILGAYWVVVDGGYANRTFVKAVRKQEMWTCTTGSYTARSGIAGCRWCMFCPAGQRRRRCRGPLYSTDLDLVREHLRLRAPPPEVGLASP